MRLTREEYVYYRWLTKGLVDGARMIVDMPEHRGTLNELLDTLEDVTEEILGRAQVASDLPTAEQVDRLFERSAYERETGSSRVEGGT